MTIFFHLQRLKVLSSYHISVQVLLQDTGERRLLAIGLVYSFHIPHFLPGWKTQGTPTVGYHVDDGKIFDAQNPYEGRDIQGKSHSDAFYFYLLFFPFILIFIDRLLLLSLLLFPFSFVLPYPLSMQLSYLFLLSLQLSLTLLLPL